MPKIAAIAIAGFLTIGIAGCASSGAQGLPDQPSVAPTGSSAAPIPTPTSSEWWGTAAPLTLPDSFVASQVMVNRGGDYSSKSADNANDPAMIADDGTISLSFHVVLAQVKRRVTEAYVSKEADGSVKGPGLSCISGTSTTTQTFDCTAVFTDPTFSSGIYYGVIETEPGLESLQSYGNLTAIVPVYTKLPG
jgi:hypothetical protein